MADHVGDPAHRHDQGHEGEEVGEPHPGHGPQPDVEGRVQCGVGHGDDAGVELADEGADADGPHRQPGGVGAGADACRAGGLHQEATPPRGGRCQLVRGGRG